MITNPFRFGTVVGEAAFCNRKEELKQLTQYVNDTYSVWLYSSRRFGKTSLVKTCFDQMKGVKTIYVDFYNVRTIDDFARKYSKLLAHELFDWKGNAQQIAAHMSGYLKNLFPKVSIDETGAFSLSLEAHKIEEEIDLNTVLDFPEKVAAKGNFKVVVAFDEFQEIERVDPFLIHWMRSVFQNQKHVSYVFLGSKQSLMKNIFTSVESPFYEFAIQMELSPISASELSSFVKKHFESAGLDISTKNINALLDKSECHPHYTQYFASVMFDMIRGGEDQEVEEFLVNWLNRVVDNQISALQSLFDILNNNQRNTLMTLAQMKDDEELFSAKVRDTYGLPVSSSLTASVNALANKGIIRKEEKVYKFNNPVFKEWIRRDLID